VITTYHYLYQQLAGKRRPGEVEGKDYHFVTPEDFQIMIHENRFLEYAKVFDHYYGTPAEQVIGNAR
jgi:guanylate kinase